MRFAATEAKTDSVRFKCTLTRFFMLFWLFMCRRREQMEEAFAAVDVAWRVVHAIEQMRYDETPMPVRTQEIFKAIPRAVDDEPAMIPQALVPALGGGLCPVQFQVQPTSGTRKILQSEQTFGFLLAQDDVYWTVIMDFPSPLLLLENESSAVMLQSLLRNSGTSLYLADLDNKTRFVIVDGHQRGFQTLLLQYLETGYQ